eukprot:1049442-Pelagomonas_calceolata.AAC.2
MMSAFQVPMQDCFRGFEVQTAEVLEGSVCPESPPRDEQESCDLLLLHATLVPPVKCSCNQTQDEARVLFNCTNVHVCPLRRKYHVLFEPYFQDFSETQPFLLHQ